jgi:hypothetical protein
MLLSYAEATSAAKLGHEDTKMILRYTWWQRHVLVHSP